MPEPAPVMAATRPLKSLIGFLVPPSGGDGYVGLPWHPRVAEFHEARRRSSLILSAR